MERLVALYQNYYQEIREASREAKPFAALFGQPLGNDPCNGQFLKDVQTLLPQLAEDPQLLPQVLAYIFEEPKRYEQGGIPAAHWNVVGVHSFTLEYIPRLEPADAARLAESFEKAYPRWDRLPVQNQVLKELKARAKG